MARLVSPDDIRTRFSRAMSEMFRREVPLYGDLLDIVAQVNAATVQARGTASDEDTTRLEVERHGAVRVGSEAELGLLRRAFAVMGMEPVGYYDLAAAGLPIHATAFRPVEADSLARNPFRVFTSLLRPELIADSEIRAEAQRVIGVRRILSPRAEKLIDRAEAEGGLSEDLVGEFVREVLLAFQWREEARVDRETYERFLGVHPLIADIASFGGPHINHLTPRTLDIDACQAEMRRRGLPTKTTIEGPPRRAVPILLRQTSFRALAEAVAFRNDDGWNKGSHTARFGEIEQRGAALKPAGRALYDRLLAQARDSSLEAAFEAFPDDEEGLRREGLAYFRYGVADLADGAPARPANGSLEALIAAGRVVARPILYEDFLPVSAAGIFRSNLGDRAFEPGGADAAEDRFAEALGRAPMDPFALYQRVEEASLKTVCEHFGLTAN